MKIEQYKEEVKRTLVVLPTLKENLIHMSYGISTEIGELLDVYKKKLAYGKEIDLVNVKEELSDILWYIFNGFNFLNTNNFLIENYINEKENHIEISYEDFKNKNLDIFFLEYILLNGSLFGIILNGNINNISHKAKIESVLKSLFLNTTIVCDKLDININEIMEMNIAKLRIRFPDKFSQDNALNRNLEEERNSLEGK